MSKKYKKHTQLYAKSKNISGTGVTKNTKKGLAFWVLFVLIIFWTVSGVLGSFAFIRTQCDKQNSVAYADTVSSTDDEYIYTSNNIFVPSNRVLRSNAFMPYPDTYLPQALVTSFTFVLEQFKDTDYYYISFSVASGTNYFLKCIEYNFDSSSWVNHGYTLKFTPTTDNDNYYFFASSETATYIYGTIRINADTDFNVGEIVSFSYSSWITDNYYDNYVVHNLFTLNDSNSKRFTFSFHYYTPYSHDKGWANGYSWTDRTYYLSSSFDDNEYFDIGYKEGYLDGKNEFENSGYQNGYEQGYNNGYNVGKNDGILSANNYSFLGLMTAVVDAPLQALTGLFNFEILGINLMNFVTATFTVLVIILLVKLILGGGKNG